LDKTTTRPLKKGAFQTTTTIDFSVIRFGNRLIKRSMDIVLTFFGLLFLSPFFAFIAYLIKSDSPGPVFYRGPRMGKNEQPFRILKFRTMYECERSYRGAKVTCKEDDRITPIGHWLRDTKINELPQLWNVLIGEMSLVGPRPEDVDIARNWPRESREEILSIQPGITSPASILYHNEENLLTTSDFMEDYFTSILPDKMRLDRLYVRNQSLSSDLDILFWTAVVIIPNMVKAKVPEGNLFFGPFSRLIQRYVSWFVVDLVTTLAAVATVGLLWRSEDPPGWSLEHLIPLAVIFTALFTGNNLIAGFNRIEWSRATVEDSVGLVFSSGAALLGVLMLNSLPAYHLWLAVPTLSVSMILMISLTAHIGFISTRYRVYLLTAIANRWLTLRRGLDVVGERVIIVGSGEGCQTATWLLRRKKLRYAFTYIGIVDDECYQKYGMRVDGCQVLGPIADLPAIVKKYDIGLILFTIPHISSETRQQMLELSRNAQVHLVFLDKLMKLLDKQLTSFEDVADPEENLELFTAHDDVTGLPNRCLFQYRLKQSLAFAKRYQTHPAVLYIDLPGCKAIERTFGPGTTEKVIKETAEKLGHYKRESDTLARVEDYEFAMIFENIPDRNTIEMIKNRMYDWLSTPFRINEKNVSFCARLSYRIDEEVYQDL
jgi:diguanylate cyclase (GGDEF)-like protein